MLVQEARWIVFTAVEAALECLMVIPVGVIVMRLQTNLPKKIWAITVFVCRLVYASFKIPPNEQVH
jgi:hypothetical protein